MTKQDFIEKVLAVLNEASGDDGMEQMFGSDLARVPLYIEKLYPAAWRRAVKLLPLRWFNVESFADVAPVVNAPEGTGYMVLPGDYLELLSFRMKGWKTACYLAQEASPKVDLRQSNRWTRGTAQRPACVLRLRLMKTGENVIGKTLHYYSLPRSGSGSGHVVEEALYVPNVEAMPDELTFDGALVEPLAYVCAATVLLSFEKGELAQAMEARAVG